MPDVLTLPQFAAIIEYAQSNGHRWKSKLGDDWMYGRSVGALQVLRNTHGPSWLKAFQPLTCAKDMLRPVQMTINKNQDGEYRVNFLGGIEDTASYSEDIVDSVSTALVMSAHRDNQKALGD